MRIWQVYGLQNPFVLGDCAGKLRERSAMVWAVVWGRDIQFGTASLELLQKSGVRMVVRSPDGRALQEEKTVSVLGVAIDPECCTQTAVTGSETQTAVIAREFVSQNT